jgi:hypothetical protein
MRSEKAPTAIFYIPFQAQLPHIDAKRHGCRVECWLPCKICRRRNNTHFTHIACHAQYYQRTGVLTFRFDQIMLPDSNVNEAASHGFVRFSVEPKANLPLETNVFNGASIYFDFNAPIVTNRTRHRIGQNFVIVRLFEVNDLLQASVQPNPVSDRVRITWVTALDYTLAVYAQTGKLKINTTGLSTGVYTIKLVGSDGKVRVGKVMVVR